MNDWMYEQTQMKKWKNEQTNTCTCYIQVEDKS